MKNLVKYEDWLNESNVDPSKIFRRKPTTDSYLNMRDFWRAELGEDHENDIKLKQKMFVGAKMFSVNINSIIPNQDYLDSDQIEKYASEDLKKAPEGVKFIDGTVVVFDGHHRIAAQILKGAKAINMKILKAKI